MPITRKMKYSKLQYEARARVAKALAHPSRLLMLDAIAEGEKCVGELTELVEADQSTVSKHLTILKQAGLIEDRKEGSKTFYAPRICCLQGFWDCVEAVLRENLKTHQAACGA
jgi:ArsR family transcriptional regulator, arsenate/arsenite/antimonite-responsive transcriptional repressor